MFIVDRVKLHQGVPCSGTEWCPFCRLANSLDREVPCESLACPEYYCDHSEGEQEG